MTREEFMQALAETRIKPRTAAAAELVLVHDRTPSYVAKMSAMSRQQINEAVQRVKKVHEQLQGERQPVQPKAKCDLKACLDEGFMTANSTGPSGPYVIEIKFETLEKMQRAHDALCQFTR